MSNRPTRLFVVSLALGLITIVSTLWFVNRSLSQQPLRLLVHDASFLPFIDELASEAKLPVLREAPLLNKDFEVRVWIGSLNGEDGFILRRSANQWSAIHSQGMTRSAPFTKSQKNLTTPKSGWDKTWQKLVDKGILWLPDASSNRCNPLIIDGSGFIVETNKDRIYRTYRYPNPQYSSCHQAKQMILIGKIIAEEFGLEWFDVGDWCGDRSSPLYPCHH
jgi:hypothetical protein